MTARRINRLAVCQAILFTAISGAAAIYGQPFVHGNSEAISIIVTMFSVLAGFLVAIIAIVGDPGLLAPGSWRTAELQRSRIVDRLVRHKWLFYLYLITLTFIFASVLIPDSFPKIVLWIERVYLFAGVLAFLCSYLLPSALMKIQQERIDSIIEHRRRAAGVNASSNNADGSD